MTSGVPGWPVAFRGSTAVRAGLVTSAQLRGPRFRRVFPDVYVRADDRDRDVPFHAAWALVAGRGVLSGYSAAAVLRAPCEPRGALPEVTVPGGGLRTPPGLVVHRDSLARDEFCLASGVGITTARRTGFDLARWAPDLTEAVVGLDALANKGRFPPSAVLELAARYPRVRGRRRLSRVVELADARSGSPMETRIRLLLVLAGLPRPEAQFVVQDQTLRTVVWLDLAYPEQKIGIEYEGAEHELVGQMLRDAARYTALVDRGWRMYRFTKLDIQRDPARIVATIRRALAVR